MYFLESKMSIPDLGLNTGRSIPAISFGTGTSFFNRSDDVASVISDAFKVVLDSCFFSQ
jgi:hypothetical protein